MKLNRKMLRIKYKKKRNSMVEKKIPVITGEDRKREILLDINKKINILELCQALMKGYFMTIRGMLDREIHLDILYNSIFCTEEKYKKNERYLLLRITAKKVEGIQALLSKIRKPEDFKKLLETNSELLGKLLYEAIAYGAENAVDLSCSSDFYVTIPKGITEEKNFFNFLPCIWQGIADILCVDLSIVNKEKKIYLLRAKRIMVEYQIEYDFTENYSRLETIYFPDLSGCPEEIDKPVFAKTDEPLKCPSCICKEKKLDTKEREKMIDIIKKKLQKKFPLTRKIKCLHKKIIKKPSFDLLFKINQSLATNFMCIYWKCTGKNCFRLGTKYHYCLKKEMEVRLCEECWDKEQKCIFCQEKIKDDPYDKKVCEGEGCTRKATEYFISICDKVFCKDCIKKKLENYSGNKEVREIQCTKECGECLSFNLCKQAWPELAEKSLQLCSQKDCKNKASCWNSSCGCSYCKPCLEEILLTISNRGGDLRLARCPCCELKPQIDFDLFLSHFNNSAAFIPYCTKCQKVEAKFSDGNSEAYCKPCLNKMICKGTGLIPTLQKKASYSLRK